jgi:hypothetical protein
LDITANCLVSDRYAEITAGVETENCDIWVFNHHYTEDACLCAEKYHNQQCKGTFGDAKWHFDIPCKTMCPWTPILTGYSGFYVREDAVQEQEGMHDASEDKWNIDLVGSAFAMSQSPPCDSNFSPACYNEKKVNFLSQDQTFSIMTGLAMVKQYIPPTATVTTCDGTVYNPFNIVQEISNGLVKLPQNTTRHVFWPGSEDDDCCYKSVKFGECAGGNLQWTYAGLEYMHNYINEGDDDHKVGIFDRNKWGRKNGRRAFFAQAMSVGFDIGTFGTDIAKQKIIDACVEDKMEILLLMNDLLHPGEPNIMDDEANADLKAMFEEMLCSAPCNGPCFKPIGYDNRPEDWPEFNCANTPHWIGQRWEGYGYPPPNQQAWNDRRARQYNGLDFMALYNTYMLCFPEEQTPFYHPDRPEPTPAGHLLGENNIEGPTTLCPGTSAAYLLKKSNPVPTVFKDIIWESSSNISLSSTTSNPTTATANSEKTPSYIGVTFTEETQKQQFYNGVAQETEGHYIDVGQPLPYWVPPQPITIEDNCAFAYKKPIISERPEYQVITEVDFCQWIYKATAHGPQYTSETTLSWVATDSNTGLTVTGNGIELDFSEIIPQTPNLFGIVSLRFTVQDNCGTDVFTLESPYFVCPNGPPGGGNTQGRQILVSPNPTNGQISIRIVQNQTQDFYSTDPNGVRIRIYPGNGNLTTLLDAQLYNNGQTFNLNNLPNGSYHVRANASDLTPIQTSFVIIH